MLINMAQRIGEHVAKVLVGETVVDHPPYLPAGHDAIVPEKTKLVTEGRLADPKEQRQIAHAQFLHHAQGMQNAKPRAIGEQGERLTDRVGPGRVQDPSQQWLYGLGVKAQGVATVGRQDI